MLAEATTADGTLEGYTLTGQAMAEYREASRAFVGTAWCLSRKTPVSRGRSAPPAEDAGAGVREWRRGQRIHPGAGARQAQPDGSRPGSTSPRYPVCRGSAQVSGMPSCCAGEETARPVGLCTRTRASLYEPREAGLAAGPALHDRLRRWSGSRSGRQQRQNSAFSPWTECPASQS